MRILMINNHIDFGGGGDAVFRLERAAYEEAGHEVFTFSQHIEKPEYQKTTDFVAFESKKKALRKIGKFLYAPRIAQSFKNTLRMVQPHFVSVHLISKYPLSIYPFLQGYPVVQTLHGPNLFCATGWGRTKSGKPCELGIGLKCYLRGCLPISDALLYIVLSRRLLMHVKRNVDLFICPSENIRDSSESNGLIPTRFVPLGIDESFVDIQRATHDGPPIVLYVGALAVQKGLMVLLDAFNLVAEKVPEANLLIAGRGSLEKELHKKTKRMELSDKVKFIGFVSRSQIADLYRRTQVVVVPSIWNEQFGLVGPEALACGVPCVGSDVGGIPEWLHDGDWGFIVPPGDARALADRIIALLEDRKLRSEFGKKGREYVVKQYNPDKYKKNRMRLLTEYSIGYQPSM